MWHCQLAVALVQTSFVIGSVYLKRSFQQVHGVHFHPIIFAFTREAVRILRRPPHSLRCSLSPQPPGHVLKNEPWFASSMLRRVSICL